MHLALLASSFAALRLACDTSVAVGDGMMEIDLWPATAPIGVDRVASMAVGGYFTNLPFFHVLPQMVLFGLQPDAALQATWDGKGDILDDGIPARTPPPDDGILCFSGDPGKNRGTRAKGRDSRSTLLFLTLGGRHLLSNRMTPWEVPAGKVVRGLDILRGIYAGDVCPSVHYVHSRSLSLAASPSFSQSHPPHRLPR